MSKPLALDYELNDPNDPESVYTRSDHYSYAAKGIPIAFFTTGLHPDYHRVSDTVDKILFPKMARIAQLVYETGFSIANTDRRWSATTRAADRVREQGGDYQEVTRQKAEGRSEVGPSGPDGPERHRQSAIGNLQSRSGQRQSTRSPLGP